MAAVQAPVINMLRDPSPSPSPSSQVFPHRKPSMNGLSINTNPDTLHTQQHPSSSTMRQRKASTASLRKLDTSSTERLVPKLSLRTVPHVKSNSSLKAYNGTDGTHTSRDGGRLKLQGSSSSLKPPHSPSHLNLTHSNFNLNMSRQSVLKLTGRPR